MILKTVTGTTKKNVNSCCSYDQIIVLIVFINSIIHLSQFGSHKAQCNANKAISEKVHLGSNQQLCFQAKLSNHYSTAALGKQIDTSTLGPDLMLAIFQSALLEHHTAALIKPQCRQSCMHCDALPLH